MIIYTFLAVSVILNCVMVWYMYRLLRNLVDMTQEFDNIGVILLNFSNHLKTVYEKETYYGDDTLQALVDHMKTVDESVENYTNMLVLFNDEEKEIYEQDKQDEEDG